MLACVPPPTYQTPSAALLDSTRTGGMVAVRDGVGNRRGGVVHVHLHVADGETERIVPAAHVHSLAFQIVIEIVMLMEGGRGTSRRRRSPCSW